jgi:acyl dehydratase
MKYWEDFPPGAVSETGTHTVTEAEILDYAREFDPQYFHVDPAAAKQSIYGGLIASGWHTTAMMMRLMVDGFLGESAALGSPGFDDLKWLRPVRPGDTIRVRSTVLEAIASRSRPDVGIVRTRTEALNQNGDVVLEMHSSGMYRRRPAVSQGRTE